MCHGVDEGKSCWIPSNGLIIEVKLCVLCGCLDAHITSFLKENIVEMLYCQNDSSPYYKNNTEKLVILTFSFKGDIICF